MKLEAKSRLAAATDTEGAYDFIGKAFKAEGLKVEPDSSNDEYIDLGVYAKPWLLNFSFDLKKKGEVHVEIRNWDHSYRLDVNFDTKDIVHSFLNSQSNFIAELEKVAKALDTIEKAVKKEGGKLIRK